MNESTMDAALPSSYLRDYMDRADRMYTLRRQLETGDIAAGNGPMAYSSQDRTVYTLMGTGLNIAAELASTAGTAGEAYGKEQLLEQTGNMDQTILDYRFGEAPGRRRQEALEAAERSHPKWQRITDAADKLGADAARELDRAKNGLSKLGQVGVDISQNAIELGFDAGIGALTGSSALPAKIARVFGTTAKEARGYGASNDEQMVCGFAVSGLKALSDLIFKKMTFIFDKIIATEVTEKTIGKLANSPSIAGLTHLLSNGISAAAKERISKGIDSIVESVYRDTELDPTDSGDGDLSDFDSSELLYDILVGFAVGLMSGCVDIAEDHSR